MPPVRVLCITPFGPSGKGGIDRLYFYLRQLPADEAMPGVDLRFAYSRGSASGNRWILAFPVVLARIRDNLRRFRPHVVHINFATGGSLPRKFAVLRLAKAHGARVVVHFHGQFIEDKIAKRTLAGRLFKAIATQADMVIALGQVHARAFERIGVAPERITIVPNGIPDFAGESVLPKPEARPLAILFSGLLTENKGMHVLISALAKLRKSREDWHCIAAGNGEVARYTEMAHQACLTDRTTFTGWLEADAMHDYMRKADVVVLPSRTEALPLSLIEGACAGAALIATAVGNVGDIVENDVSGYLVPRDADALASALCRLATDRELLHRMQGASRQAYLDKFTLASFARNLREVYLSASRSSDSNASSLSTADGDRDADR
jgi:glycosyltransferase involved in cell wall biosynthesis